MTRQTSRAKLAIASLAAVVAMSLFGGAGLASAGTGYHETFTQAIAAGSALNAVSCVPSTSICVAADSKGDLFYSTDASTSLAATWNPWSGPGASPGHAVECPSATLCLFAAGEVGGGGGSMYRTSSLGGGFFTSFTSANGISAISCPSTDFCVSTQLGNGFIRYSTNPSSFLWTAVSIGSGAMKDVFCLSASFCAVVDDTGNLRVATTEDGVKEGAGWTATNVGNESPLHGIACSSTTSCVAVDGGDEALNLTIGPSGDATASRQVIDGADGLVAVDCTGSTCAAVDEQGGIFASTNAGADWIVRHGGGAGLTGVSCASASLCAAVTTAGSVTTFNPATTTPPLTITTASLPGGEAGASYEAEVQATGGEPPYEWSAIDLPPGLSIDSATGEISGIAADVLCVGEPCLYPGTFTVTDDNGTEASLPLTIALAVNAYALKVATGGTGSGEVSSSPAGIDECGTPGGSCEAPYEDGTVVTLTATAAANSTFAGWSGGGCSGTGTCQVTLSAGRDVTATFSEIPPPPPPLIPTHTLTVQPVGEGQGSVRDNTGAISCPPTCSHSYGARTPLILVANPESGSRFMGWSVSEGSGLSVAPGGGCAGIGACHLTIGADTTLTARFARILPLSARLPARLRINRVRARVARAKVRIVVAGTILRRARGAVRVRVATRVRGRRVIKTKRVRIQDGRWRVRFALPRAKRNPKARFHIAARFGGSPGVRPGHAKRCVQLNRPNRRCG